MTPAELVEAWERTQAEDAEATARHKCEIVLRLHQSLCDNLVELLNDMRNAWDEAPAQDPLNVMAALGKRLERLVSFRVVPRLIKGLAPAQQEEKPVADEQPPGAVTRELSEDMEFVKGLKKNEAWQKPGSTGQRLVDLAYHWTYETVALRSKYDDTLRKLNDYVHQAQKSGGDLPKRLAEANAALEQNRKALDLGLAENEQLKAQLADAQGRADALRDANENLKARLESLDAAYKQLEAATAGSLEPSMEAKFYAEKYGKLPEQYEEALADLKAAREALAVLQKEHLELEAEAKALETMTEASNPRLKKLAEVEAEVYRLQKPALDDEEAQSVGHAVFEIIKGAA